MRVLSHTFAPSAVFNCFPGQVSYQQALKACCDVLEIDDPKSVDLSPSDSRALEELSQFFRSIGGFGPNRAHTLVNLNTGRSVLLLCLAIDYNGDF